MFGLSRTDAAAASLLLTLEGPATAVIAWFVFHENFDRRIALAHRFAGEFQDFNKDAAAVLIELGIIKTAPKTEDLVDTRFIQ